MRLVLLLALAAVAGAAERRDLFHEEVRIPRNQWRAIRVSLQERPATVHCRFRVQEGKSDVRALLMTASDTERFRQGETFRMLAASGSGGEGRLDFRLSRPGDYMLLIDNRTSGGEGVMLDLEAWLEFRPGESFAARELPRDTRLIVAGLGLIWLSAAGGWPGWLIWKAWRRRREALRDFYIGRF